MERASLEKVWRTDFDFVVVVKFLMFNFVVTRGWELFGYQSALLIKTENGI